jgi:hypothetical protein
VPADWQGVNQVTLARLSGEGPEPRGAVPVVAGEVTLGVGKGEALKICACKDR